MPTPMLATVTDRPIALTADERDELLSLEATVEQGLQTFISVGTALLTIRGRRLYREDYATFEQYCRDRWQISRPRAYQLMQAAAVVENLSTTGRHAAADDPEHQEHDDQQPILPTSERQARELAGLTLDAQRAAWGLSQDWRSPDAPALRTIARAARTVSTEQPDLEGYQLQDAIRRQVVTEQTERARTRKVDPNRVVESMASSAELLTDDVELIDYAALDDTKIDDWIARFEAAQQHFAAFIATLKAQRERRS